MVEAAGSYKRFSVIETGVHPSQQVWRRMALYEYASTPSVSTTISSDVRIGVISAMCGVNFPNWLIIPRNRRIPLTSVGSGMSIIDWTLSWSGLNPDSLMVWPKNLTSWSENWHFFKFNVTFSFWSLLSTSRMRSSCWLCVAPNMSMSSIWHNTPSIPSRMADILLWKCSGADEMPKGNRLKQNLPKGVMKVVSKADSSANGTFQKPEFAFSLENIPASDNCPRVYSTEGISCRSWRTLCFVHQWQSYPSWDVDIEGLGIILEINIFVRTLHIAKAIEEIWVFSTIVDRALARLHSADQMRLIYRWVSQ